MKMYCRDCRKVVEVRKENSKNKYTKDTYYFCQECGVIVLTMFENKRIYD